MRRDIGCGLWYITMYVLFVFVISLFDQGTARCFGPFLIGPPFWHFVIVIALAFSIIYFY